MKKLTLIIFIFLVGCSSEVDKCVQAGLKAWDEIPIKDAGDTRTQAEARWRLACLESVNKPR